jgi:hypothetical protein
MGSLSSVIFNHLNVQVKSKQKEKLSWKKFLIKSLMCEMKCWNCSFALKNYKLQVYKKIIIIFSNSQIMSNQKSQFLNLLHSWHHLIGSLWGREKLIPITDRYLQGNEQNIHQVWNSHFGTCQFGPTDPITCDPIKWHQLYCSWMTVITLTK